MNRYSSPVTTIAADENNGQSWKASFHPLAYAHLHAAAPAFIAIALERQHDSQYSVLIVCLVALSIVFAALSIYFFTKGRSKFLRLDKVQKK
jgi:hypothetical protein